MEKKECCGRIHSYAAVMTAQNNRQEIAKPNEDAYVMDHENGIYLIADGVTWPNEEYFPGGESIVARCAETLCQCVREHLLCNARSDPREALRDAMIAGNRAIRPLRSERQCKYPPCATFLGAVLKEDTLYFYNCCDTIGFIIRDDAKIQITDHQNHHADILRYSKDRIYEELHNNIKNPVGFGIFNGDEGLKDFLTVSRIALYPGDRIILASDGLSNYLHVTRASHLREVSLQQMFDESAPYDKPPYMPYADDKTCILIDIVSE